MSDFAETTQYSFDVFDTAVCRLVHSPEHVHLNVGRLLRHRGVIELSDAEWLYARVHAEYYRRLKVADREVTLAQIYAQLAGALGLDDDAVRTAMDTEIGEELRLVRPIAGIRETVEQLAAAGSQPLFLSDTYLSSASVRAMLARAGYRDPLDVVTSCEHRRSKYAGTLYAHVAEQRGLTSRAFFHTGDNPVGDISNARSNGWRATHYTESQWTTRERVLFAAGDGGFLNSVIAGSARAARLGQPGPLPAGIGTAAASVVGPLFAAYVLWLLRDVAARGGRTVYFLARDGYTLAPMGQRLAGWLGVDIEARYLLASRQAFLLPALADTDDEHLAEEALGLAFRDRTPLSAALTALKYRTAEIDRVCREAGVDARHTRSQLDPAAWPALVRALQQPDLAGALRERVAAAQAATLAYLEAEGLFAAEEAIIVDLGWRGTTQLRLQRAVGDRVQLVGYYLGLSNPVLGAADQVRVWPPVPPAVKTALLEMMAAADHTPVQGFGFNQFGRPVCEPLVTADPALVTWGARIQRDIAVRFVEYLTAAIELDHFRLDEVYAALETAALAAYRHFRLSPTLVEAATYGGVQHADDVNHLYYREVAAVVSGRDLARHLFDRSARGAASSWYTGSLARSREYALPRTIHRGLERTLLLQARLTTRRRRQAAYRAAEESLGPRASKLAE